MTQEPNQIKVKVEPFISNNYFQVFQDVKPKWWQFWKKKEQILVMEGEPSKLPFSFTIKPQIKANIKHLEKRAEFYLFKEEVLEVVKELKK